MEPIRITTWSLLRKRIRSSLALMMLISAAQFMFYATILNRIIITTTDIKSQTYFGMVPGALTYTIRGFWENFTERLRSN